MSKTKKAPSQTAESPTFDLSSVKQRADGLGCFMQMFVAYNPDTETFLFACNDPCACEGTPSEEALMLAALVVEHLADEANPAKPAKPQKH